MKKLEAIGFSDQYTRWFWSYLCEQIFFTEIENQLSDYGRILCGVPQGSILGPLMFFIYINDILQAVKSNLFSYVDDSCLTYQHRDVEEIEKQLKKSLENICDWFVNNKLSTHFGKDKTKSILLQVSVKSKIARKLNIKYKDKKIKQHLYVPHISYFWMKLCLRNLIVVPSASFCYKRKTKKR